jgi:hypothetical protein
MTTRATYAQTAPRACAPSFALVERRPPEPMTPPRRLRRLDSP